MYVKPLEFLLQSPLTPQQKQLVADHLNEDEKLLYLYHQYVKETGKSLYPGFTTNVSLKKPPSTNVLSDQERDKEAKVDPLVLLQLFQQKIAETGKFTYPPFVQFMQGENNISFRILSVTKAREDICKGADRLADRLDELMRKNPNDLEEVEIAFRQITKGIAHIVRQGQDVYDQSNRLVKTIRFGSKQRNTVRQMESLNDLLISSYYQVMLEPRNPKIVKLTRGYLIELKVTAIRWEVLINEILDSHNTRFSMGIKRSSR
ncbi:MAG: hypothetical protein DWQ56_22350 [Microcystis aeruginosa DA14]|uniref:Uncharacterized protein n=1 Tax=Microcystis aeruginosa DA14 TaxID=1987506 RepID=A0A3E0LZK7_MICAE|nr:MAG: hypothetical protein DWQ56_22350 [Microcystis aeruginosa DA14]